MATAHAERTNGPTAARIRDQRLAFLESLLSCDTLLAAAELGVDWLARNARVGEVVVALVHRELGGAARLIGVAAHGLAGFDGKQHLSIFLEARDHPLVQAMLGGKPVVLAPVALGVGGLGFADTRCTAYPLPFPASGDRDAVGVVVVGGQPKDPHIRWGLRHLGRRLGDLASLRLIGAAENRLDVIIDSVADPIIVTDANGATVMTNAPAERLFTALPGSPTEEMRRVRANDALFSSHVANLLTLAPGERFRGELSLLDPKTATHVPVEAISGKLASRQGEVSAIVTILHDQTEAMEKHALYEALKRASSALEDKVKDATAELVRQNKLLHRQAIELEAASSAKSLFLANMSHEFRTPLNAILGYTSMMLQGVSGPLPAKLNRQLLRIDSNGRHLLTIINDILDIARIEAGKMPFNPAKFVVGALVKEVLAELEPLIVRSKLRVGAEIGKVVPILNTDRAKVKQVLVNLISNALKFTPEGSVTVSAQWDKRTNETWISVADTGIGIGDADQEVVFQDFRQVDNSPTRQYGGTGLGLAICRRLAAVLGGEVRLVSNVDRGSTFTLVLPAKVKGPASQKGTAR